MSRGDWGSVAATLILAGVAYFIGGARAAFAAIVIGLSIGAILHFTKKKESKAAEEQGDNSTKRTKSTAFPEDVRQSQAIGKPDIQSRFTFEKNEARIEVMNRGTIADVWAPLKPEGMLRRFTTADVFARWTHTDAVKTRIAKGQTCQLRLASFDVDYRTLSGQWRIYWTTDNGPLDDRPMYSTLLGNKDVQTPDVHLHLNIVSDPDCASGIKKHHVVLHTSSAEEV